MLILLTIPVQFLGIHIKGTQKYLISQCKMGQQEPSSDTDTSTDLQLVALDNLRCSQPSSQPSASTSTAPPSTVRLKTYSSKQRRLQITRCIMGTVADTALCNSTPFAEQCYHIIQYLHSPEIDRYYPDYINDKHARQNFKRKADKYKWDETRQELFYPNADQFKNRSNLQFLVIQFFFFVNPGLCVCTPRNVMYLFVCCVCPGISLLLYNSFQSSMFQSLLMKKSSGG